MKYFTFLILTSLFLYFTACGDSPTGPSGNGNPTSQDSLIYSRDTLIGYPFRDTCTFYNWNFHKFKITFNIQCSCNYGVSYGFWNNDTSVTDLITDSTNQSYSKTFNLLISLPFSIHYSLDIEYAPCQMMLTNIKIYKTS